MSDKTHSSPKMTDRARAQRERIMCAAQKCFVDHGFHAAGMALIAETAEMSPGLIYRYFENKDAIILAIVERQLENSRAGIRSLHEAPDFATAAFDCFKSWRDEDPRLVNASLFLEMSMEAKRNPLLAAALRRSDQELRNELANWMSADPAAGGKGLPAEVAELRAVSLQCFMEGLAVRALRDPGLDENKLKATIIHFVESVFRT